MEDNRLVKEVVFGEIGGKTKRGRPGREWLDHVKECCNEEIYIVKIKAQDVWKKQLNVHWTPMGDEPMELWMDNRNRSFRGFESRKAHPKYAHALIRTTAHGVNMFPAVLSCLSGSQRLNVCDLNIYRKEFCLHANLAKCVSVSELFS